MLIMNKDGSTIVVAIDYDWSLRPEEGEIIVHFTHSNGSDGTALIKQEAIRIWGLFRLKHIFTGLREMGLEFR